MNQSKKGVLTLAMIISLSMMCGAQVVKAADGDFNEAGGISLKDTNSNGKIDEVHITVDYGVAVATGISYADAGTMIGKFTVTDAGTNELVEISSIAFVSGDGTIAIFGLTLNEDDENLSINTSGAALDVVYDATGSDLKITDDDSGSADVDDAIADSIEEKDGAAPIAISATYKDSDLDGIVDEVSVTYSENIEESIFTASEWSFPTNPHPLAVSSGTFLAADVLIAVTGAPTDSTVLDDTTVKYTAGTGITDGTNSAVTSAELPIMITNDDNEEEEDDEITPPDGSLPGPATPNYHSGVTLYRMPGSPRVYVIKNKKKHWIKTAKEFEDSGYSWGKIQEISAELLEEYPEAETFASELLRAVGDCKVYRTEGGKKHWIRTAGEFNAAGYNWRDIQEVSPEVLASYQNEVLSELLRAAGDHKVYRIRDGKKRWIRTAGEFNAAGYRWEDIEEVPVQDLDGYPDSNPDPDSDSDSDSEDASIEIVNALSLRVRNADSTAGDILGSVKKSEVYKVIEKKNGWYKIKMKSGKAGWVSGSYVEEQ